MVGRRQDTKVVLDVCSQVKRKREVKKKSRFDELPAMDEVWNRTVRTDTQHRTTRKKENHLASTQRWRNLLFSNEAQDAPLVISEEIFRENVNVLLNDIDECALNPDQWSREHTNSFFDTIRRFLDSWKRQLLEEKDKMDLEALLLKGKFENKHDLVTNRLNMLTGVFHESLTFMEFSEFQKKAMQSQVKELNDVRNRFGENRRLVSEPSLATELENKNHDVIGARKQVDEYLEELRKIQSGLKETNLVQMKTALMKFSEFQRKSIQAKVHGKNDVRGIVTETKQLVKSESSLETDLKNKDYELIEARRLADQYREELRKTQDHLKAHLKLRGVMHTNNQLTQVNQQGMLHKCLQDKEKQLNDLKKQLDCRVQKQMETESELRETREHLQSLVAKNAELIHDLKKQLDCRVQKQMETESELRETREHLQILFAKNAEMALNRPTDLNKKLSEIQTLLLMKNPKYKPNCRIESDGLSKEEKILRHIKAMTLMTLERQTDLNKKLSEIQALLLMKNPKYKSNCRIESDGFSKEEKILRDIKALIECDDLQSIKSALETNSGSGFLKVSEYEIHLVTLIAACLKVTPFPLNSNYIHSYVANIDNAVDLQFVENLLRKFPSFFKKVAVAPESRDKNWTYLDLKPVITI